VTVKEIKQEFHGARQKACQDKRVSYLFDRLDEYLQTSASPLEAWELGLLDYKVYIGAVKK
jgi:hypothetical protein